VERAVKRAALGLLAALATALALSNGAHSQSVAILPGVVKAAPAQPGNPSPTLHAPWSQCDVGSPPAAGTGTNGGGTMQLNGTGDLGSNNNNNVLIAHVVNQPWTGDVDFVTKVSAITGTFDYRQAGILFSQAQCANTAPWVAVSATVETLSSQQGIGFHLDGIVNGRSTSYTTGSSGALPPPQWIRLARNGAVVSAYRGSSATGPWTLVDSEARAFSGTYYIGTFCTSADTVSTQLAGCAFTEPIITAPVGNAGTLSFSQATQTVTEGGTFTPCVNRNGGTSGAVSAHVHDAGGGSATNLDWTTGDLDQTVTFADADGAQKCVGTAVRTTNRAGTQLDRTINLSLTTFTGGAAAGSQPTQVVTIQDAITTTGAKKWHPGSYMECCLNSTDLNSQASRFAQYDYFDTFSNIKGVYIFFRWVDLEPTAGNYTAGINLIKSEIAHLQNEPRPLRFIFALMDEPNSGICHSYACQDAFYPAYLQSTCLAHQQFNNANDVNTVFKYWIPSCATAMANLWTAIGAGVDSQAFLEAVQLAYEQQLQPGPTCCGDFNLANYNNGVHTVLSAAAAAFPHTNLKWNANWGISGHESDLVTLLGYAKALGIGWGAQDACSIDPITSQNVYGTYPIYQDAQNIFAGYGGYDSGHHPGTYTDQRGAMFSMDGVETSELGYAVVCNGQGFAGRAPVASPPYVQGYMSLIDEHNAEWNSHPHIYFNTFTGTPVQQFSVGTTYSLWDQMQNFSPTHTNCPTDYDVLFGNGIRGSQTGCNTQ
jgi:hypothetical protein